MNNWINLLTDMLLSGAFIFVILSSMTGLAFLLVPGKAVGVERKADRRFSLRKILKPMEIPRQTERFFYRYHRLTGGFIMALAALFLWLALVSGEGSRIAVWVKQQAGGALLGAWTENLGWMLVVMNVGAFVVGTIMLVRPSALKSVESLANRWMSTRKATRPLDSEHDPLGRFAGRHPRLFGALVLGGSLYIFLNLVMMLR